MDNHLIRVIRYSNGGQSFLSLLFIDNSWECYGLENVSAMIPEGLYQIGLNTEVGMNHIYKQRYPEIHVGMLEIKNVPGRTYILIHQGNQAADSAGCLLVGDSVNDNQISMGFIGQSDIAYKKIYPVISQWLKNGGQVQIQIKSIQEVFNGITG